MARPIDAEELFSAIGDKEDDIAEAKDRAAGDWETYYGGVADGLLLAKGLIAEEETIEIYQKLDALYKNLEYDRERNIHDGNATIGYDFAQARYYLGRADATAMVLYKIAAILGWKRMDKLAIAHAEEPSEVTELCPHCESEVTLQWDVKDRGYKAYCPVCGKRLMLCLACRGDGYGCDYDTETDECRWNPAEKGRNENAD